MKPCVSSNCNSSVSKLNLSIMACTRLIWSLLSWSSLYLDQSKFCSKAIFLFIWLQIDLWRLVLLYEPLQTFEVFLKFFHGHHHCLLKLLSLWMCRRSFKMSWVVKLFVNTHINGSMQFESEVSSRKSSKAIFIIKGNFWIVLFMPS